ncbi:MAG: type I restriction-modification system subunit M N-terminal domain-containing protein [Pirellula sp.]|nr:type I restriction-modification system subunit M N-terminal domain-containing protein [Pirellula sp.]
MDQAAHNKIVSFIWGIADDVLRDLFVRGKYRDVILPMFVLRRLDALMQVKTQPAPMYGLYSISLAPAAGGGRGEAAKASKAQEVVIEYEPDPDLRDTEQVPLQEEVEAFMRREVLPYTPDAWIDASSTKISYKISFTRHFYKPQPLRSLEEICADILALEQETEGMLAEIVGATPRLL